MKKYLLLIPTLFLMLLNVFSCGQVVYADESIDYSILYKDPKEVPDILSRLDFRTADVNFSGRPNYSDYLYVVYSKKPETDDYLSLQSHTIKFYLCFYDLTNVTFTSDDNFVTSDSNVTEKVFCFTFSGFDANMSLSSSSGYSSFIRYYSQSGFVERSTSILGFSDTTYYDPNIYLWVVDSNVLDINDSYSNVLNIDVHFKPSLSGIVDRLITDSDGDTSLSNRMRFTLTNNSKFPIQYSLFILDKSFDDVHIAKYDERYVFMYYSTDWVYAPSLDSSMSYTNLVPQFQNKSTNVHYVAAGESICVLFNYSQINLIELQEYTVYVTATRCDLDHASEIVAHPLLDITEDMQAVREQEVVYQSDFSMAHYSDVKYNPNDTSNGVMPFSSAEDIKKYSLSYNASEKSDGTIDYKAKDIYSDRSPWSDSSSSSGESGSYYGSSSSVSSSFNSLSHTFSDFFSFVDSTFNYFPSSYKIIISLGLTSIVVLGLIKVVFR